MNFQIGSLIFCHSGLHTRFGHLFVLYTSQVKSMSFDLSCLMLAESTHVVLIELKFML